jgi:signal transduction histidine kinase
MNLEAQNKSTILIVDDTPHNLGVLFEYLTSYSFKVLVAIDGESALEQAAYTKPDIILLDVMMPSIDGFEVCQRLKANQETQDIPVIFMTALSDTVDKVRGFNMGAVDYITKPLQHEEVLGRVQTHLTLRSLQKELKAKNEELYQINQNLQQLVESKTKQLIAQEKSVIIGRLTQGVIHNIRNPLQVIVLCLDLLENMASKSSNLAMLDTVKKVELATDKINHIVDKLMRKSILNTTMIKGVNINDLLNQSIEFFQENLIFKNKLHKEIKLDEKIPILEINSSEISQVFDNLIDNAVDAMWNKDEPLLTIVTRQDQDYIYVDFQDNGCGIEAENLSNIFEPFYTTKATIGEEKSSKEPTGTGLGLYTCVEILKPFGGEIKVTSKVGKGSIFTVVLPKVKKE